MNYYHLARRRSHVCVHAGLNLRAAPCLLEQKMSRGVKVGDKFGKLTVEKVLGKRSVCRCECGKRRTIYNCNLLAKRNTSCGKCSHFGTNHRLEGLPVGYRSGKLVVIGPDPTVKRCKDSRTICKCDCGRVISVITSLLRPSSSARQYILADMTKDSDATKTGPLL